MAGLFCRVRLTRRTERGLDFQGVARRSPSPLGGEEGGLAVEAALTMPFFLTFVLAMIAFMQVAMAGLALETAVADTVKSIAANSYPARVLIQEAAQSGIGQNVANWLEQAKQIYERFDHYTGLLNDYRQHIPEPLIRLIEFQSDLRDQAADELKRRTQEQINEWFAALIWQNADRRVLRREWFRVTGVELPDLTGGGQAFLTVEAEYDLRLTLPFATVRAPLRKRISERCWIGA